MWEKMTTMERVFSIVVVMGSIVDIFQFTWLIKRSYFNLRKKLYNKVRKEILLNMHEEKSEKDKKPFLGFEEDK